MIRKKNVIGTEKKSAGIVRRAALKRGLETGFKISRLNLRI